MCSEAVISTNYWTPMSNSSGLLTHKLSNIYSIEALKRPIQKWLRSRRPCLDVQRLAISELSFKIIELAYRDQNCCPPIHWFFCMLSNSFHVFPLHCLSFTFVSYLFMFINVVFIHRCLLALYTRYLPEFFEKITGILLGWDSNPRPLQF